MNSGQNYLHNGNWTGLHSAELKFLGLRGSSSGVRIADGIGFCFGDTIGKEYIMLVHCPK